MIILQYLAVVTDSFSKSAHEIPRWWLPFYLLVRKFLTNTHCASGWRCALLLPALALFFWMKHPVTQTVHASGSGCLGNQTPFGVSTEITWMWCKHTKQCLMKMGKKISTGSSSISETKEILPLPLNFILGFWQCLLLEWEGYKLKGWTPQMW